MSKVERALELLLYTVDHISEDPNTITLIIGAMSVDLIEDALKCSKKADRRACLSEYIRIGVFDPVSHFYTTSSGPEARLVWETCIGSKYDYWAFLEMWDPRDVSDREAIDAIPQWKLDILRGVSLHDRRERWYPDAEGIKLI